MVLVRKDKAGSDSFGNRWEEDGAVVDVPDGQVAELLEIQDGGFSLHVPDVEEDDPPQDPPVDPVGDGDPPQDQPVDPVPVPVVEPTKPGRKPAARKD